MEAKMNKFSQTGVIILLGGLTLINLLLFSIPGIPGSQSHITANAPGETIIDMRIRYTPTELSAFLEAIGTEGRAAYQTMHTTTDFAFPLIYGLFLFALLSRLTIKQQLPLWLPWMALVATIADLVENFTLMRLTSHYPDFQPGLAHLAQVATIIKFAFIVLSAACLLWGLCRSLIHRRS